MTPNDTRPHWSFSLPIDELAKQFGSPFYLYNLPSIRQQCQKLREAFGPAVDIFYAVKANANPEILRIFREEMMLDGLDVASSGEFGIALETGWKPEQISYTGPAKRKKDLKRAILHNIGAICVESVREFQQIIELLNELPNHRPQLMIRVNPTEEIHAYGLKTSGRPTPFGIDEEELSSFLPLLHARLEQIDFRGLHIHAGSQCFSAKAFARSFKNIFGVAKTFTNYDISIKMINLGGGFGLSTSLDGRQLSINGVAQHLRTAQTESGIDCKLRIEPGRFIISPAGIYVAQIISQKESRGRNFSILDGGMNHLFEAAHFAEQYPQKQYRVENLSRPNEEKVQVDICGPLCTPRDKLGQNIMLQRPQIGDYLGWPNTGGYGLSASPILFLGHDTHCEVLYDGKVCRSIRDTMGLSSFH